MWSFYRAFLESWPFSSSRLVAFIGPEQSFSDSTRVADRDRTRGAKTTLLARATVLSWQFGEQGRAGYRFRARSTFGLQLLEGCSLDAMSLNASASQAEIRAQAFQTSQGFCANPYIHGSLPKAGHGLSFWGAMSCIAAVSGLLCIAACCVAFCYVKVGIVLSYMRRCRTGEEAQRTVSFSLRLLPCPPNDDGAFNLCE